jgi:hypothetical protein
MFQFSRSRLCILCIQIQMVEYYSHRVSPFGYLRVIISSDSPELFAGSTSFFAYRCQGIPQQPLKAWPQIDLQPLSNFNICIRISYAFAYNSDLKRLFYFMTLVVIIFNYLPLILYLQCAFTHIAYWYMTFKKTNLLWVDVNMVRLPRFELGTSTLSVSRSNQLSYNRKN